MTKYYVVSGELQEVVTAKDVITAIEKALQNCHKKSNGKMPTLNPYNVYVDERGFRENREAEYVITVDKALKIAGYIFEDENGDDINYGDDDDDNDGGTTLLIPAN